MSSEALKKVEETLDKLHKECNESLRKLEVADRSVAKEYSHGLLLRNMMKELFTFSNIKLIPTLLKLAGLGAPIVGGIISYQTLPLEATVVNILLITGIMGVILRNSVVKEMTTFDGKYFNLGAYEVFKKEEYLMLCPFIGVDFKKINDDLAKLTKEDSKKIQEYQDEIKKYQKKIEESELVLTTLVENLVETEANLEFTESKYEMVNEFLYKLKDNLSLLVRNRLDLQNLDFGVNYSLYSLQDGGIKIEEVFGINKEDLPRYISLEEWDHPFIQALEVTPSNHLYEENTMISWSLRLESGHQWVVNLHLDERNKEKLNPEKEHGKINIKITQELLWLCCELLNKFVPVEESSEGRV